ncbi:MAG: PstC family ABC transporter permease [Adlercreutzia equolifaciens]
MTWRPANDLFGIFPMIVGSLYVTAGAIVVGVPGGLLTAVYLSRFARGRVAPSCAAAWSCWPAFRRWSTASSVWSSSCPSCVCSGRARALGAGSQSYSGHRDSATIITVAQSALDAVPARYYEGALALGVDHEHAVFKVVAPAAASGIMAAIVLGLGRAIGETMAVVMVAGNMPIIPDSLLSGVRTMTANIVLEMGYAADLHREALIATGVVLFVFILLITMLLNVIRKRGEAR